MSISLGMYLADILRALSISSFLLAAMFIIVSAICAVIAVENNNKYDKEDYNKFIGFAKRALVDSIVLILITCFIPSKATVYTYMAESVGEQILKNPDAQEIMGDTILLLKKKLKEELSDD